MVSSVHLPDLMEAPFLTTGFIINLTYITYLMVFLIFFFFFGIRLLICCDIPENAFCSRDFRNEQKSKPKGLMSITEGKENIRQCSVREVRGCISSESNQWVESLVGKPWRFPQLLAEPLK